VPITDINAAIYGRSGMALFVLRTKRDSSRSSARLLGYVYFVANAPAAPKYILPTTLFASLLPARRFFNADAARL
jgi:hypothetical protein